MCVKKHWVKDYNTEKCYMDAKSMHEIKLCDISLKQ